VEQKAKVPNASLCRPLQVFIKGEFIGGSDILHEVCMHAARHPLPAISCNRVSAVATQLLHASNPSRL
jgi:hypothetical protein